MKFNVAKEARTDLLFHLGGIQTDLTDTDCCIFLAEITGFIRRRHRANVVADFLLW